jgi:hypothetical protein
MRKYDSYAASTAEEHLSYRTIREHWLRSQKGKSEGPAGRMSTARMRSSRQESVRKSSEVMMRDENER